MKDGIPRNSSMAQWRRKVEIVHGQPWTVDVNNPTASKDVIKLL